MMCWILTGKPGISSQMQKLWFCWPFYQNTMWGSIVTRRGITLNSDIKHLKTQCRHSAFFVSATGRWLMLKTVKLQMGRPKEEEEKKRQDGAPTQSRTQTTYSEEIWTSAGFIRSLKPRLSCFKWTQTWTSLDKGSSIHSTEDRKSGGAWEHQGNRAAGRTLLLLSQNAGSNSISCYNQEEAA